MDIRFKLVINIQVVQNVLTTCNNHERWRLLDKLATNSEILTCEHIKRQTKILFSGNRFDAQLHAILQAVQLNTDFWYKNAVILYYYIVIKNIYSDILPTYNTVPLDKLKLHLDHPLCVRIQPRKLQQVRFHV